MRWKPAALLLALVAALACGSGIAGPVVRDGFSAAAFSGRLVLRNDSPATIRYVALEERIAAVVDLAPPEDWPALAPGEAKRIPYQELMGYGSDATQARIYWWTDGHYGKDIVIDLP